MKDQIKILKEEVDQFNAEAGPQKFDAIVWVFDGRGPHAPFEYKITGIEAEDENDARDQAEDAGLKAHALNDKIRKFGNPKIASVMVRPEGDDFEPNERELDAYYNR